jgi:hypothetical protein
MQVMRYYCGETSDIMKRFLISFLATLALSASAIYAQEFTAKERVAPQPGPSRPAVEQNSNSSWYKKFVAAQNKLQLVSPFAPRQYGSGEQVVVADPQDPLERPHALRLFSIAF